MAKIGKGVVPPAKFNQIIDHIYQNQSTSDEFKIKTHTIYSLAKLTTSQKQSMIYPGSMVPLDKYLILQIDTYDQNKVLTNTILNLISFAKGLDNKFIYTVHFGLLAQNRFEVKDLIKSSKPIGLASTAVLINLSQSDVYYDICGTPIKVSVSTDQNGPYAVVEYGSKNEYHEQNFNINGIFDAYLPEIDLDGLSRNLKHVHLKNH